MDEDRVRSALRERVFGLTPEEFEQFCKILVEQTERPRHIELTPFHGDGGIDVRGSIGTEIYEAKFGVQVKLFTNRVGTPAMRDFMGALLQHDYQFGAFITSSAFNSGAIEVASDQRTQPISLIDGERLTDIMLASRLGVSASGSSFRVDESFWSMFGTTAAEKGLVKSDAVPQADSLSVLNVVLEGIESGHRVKHQIARFMSNRTDTAWVARQADYYAQALWALGYVHKDATTEHEGHQIRQWGLTRDGKEYLAYLNGEKDSEAESDLIAHIRETDIVEPVLSELRSSQTVSYDELREIIETESELNGTTAGRRRGTVGKWVSLLPEVKQTKQGRSFQYEYLGTDLSDF